MKAVTLNARSMLASCDCCDFRGLHWVIAAPDHMEIGSEQQYVATVDIARDLILDFKNADWSGTAGDGLCQSGNVGLAPPKLQNGKSVRRNAILDRRTVVQPDMRKPRARPRGRLIGRGTDARARPGCRR